MHNKVSKAKVVKEMNHKKIAIKISKIQQRVTLLRKIKRLLVEINKNET